MVRKAKKTHLITIYAIICALGLLLGMAARPYVSDARADNVQDLVKKALEQIASGDKAGPDAGVGVVVKKGARAFAPSPEPELPDGGVATSSLSARTLPQPDPEGGRGKSVLIVKIREDIEMGLPAYIRRAIADNPDAVALIVDIDTPGGRVDAATEIRDTLIGTSKKMRTVAFIHPRAISAGAFISFACDLIFIADGGTIGAATPIQISGTEVAPVEEKMVSYFRTEMAATARAKGRRGDIAEAMVDADVEIEGITPTGKLLTLDTTGALRHDIADGVANSMDEVLQKLALSKARRVTVELNWAERVAQFLTSPILAGLLMSIGMLGLLIELYQPGFGAPGIIGLVCLTVFFAGHLVVHLAGWEEVLLFVVGVVLLVVEVYVTPGFGVAGVVGVVFILVSLVLAISALPIDVSFNTGELKWSLARVVGSMLAVAVMLFAAMAILPKTRFRSVLVLETSIDGTTAGGNEGKVISEVVSKGLAGVAETYLRPAGIARFGGMRVDVTTQGDFIEKGEKVVIIRAMGNHVVVRKESKS